MRTLCSCRLQGGMNPLPLRDERHTILVRASRYFRLCRGPLKNVIAIYPGTFDPLTNGHLDLIHRGSKIFDQLIVAILKNSEKTPLFTLAERTDMLKKGVADLPNVQVDTFEGLLVDYARRQNASAVLRGIRAVSDYEYELQMALMNRKLDPHIETIFMMPAEAYSYLSSRLVREIARLGGSVHGLVPPFVEERLRQKIKLHKPGSPRGGNPRVIKRRS
jgi:pantetheine-phosphate adenylyltransferase